MGKKKTFCAELSQKVLIRSPLQAALVSRIALFRAVVLTAAPDPEVIYSPLFELYALNIRDGSVAVKCIYVNSKLSYIEFLDTSRQSGYITG